MILIADSGSSKTDWRYLTRSGRIAQAQTKGFNPYYQPESHFRESVAELPPAAERVESIHYYGTGVSSNKNVKVIHDVLAQAFPGAQIEVQHDLLAAARALCGKEEGIACILGTGSSSCFYDGDQIIDDLAGLGFILGDEGSGSYLGKRLLADLLYNIMPAGIKNTFEKRFPLSRSEILDNIYNGERPARFLASFAKFAFDHRNEPYCHALIHSSFMAFIEKSVMRYSRYREVKTHFTGSIAFYFSDFLRQAATEAGITVKNIVQSPIAGLTLYHQSEVEEAK